MKICSRCKQSKPFSDFYPSPRYKDGYASWCRPCHAERRRATYPAYYEANKERMQEKSRRNHAENRERDRANQKQWYEEHREEYLQRMKDNHAALKTEVFAAYGGAVCACCGESHIGFLSIDHINGGGGQHRKALKVAGVGFYAWLKRNSYPPGYQVLCYNCNLGREHWGHGICPHKSQR